MWNFMKWSSPLACRSEGRDCLRGSTLDPARHVAGVLYEPVTLPKPNNNESTYVNQNVATRNPSALCVLQERGNRILSELSVLPFGRPPSFCTLCPLRRVRRNGAFPQRILFYQSVLQEANALDAALR